MRTLRIPGVLAYAAMAMWLLQILVAPVRAQETEIVPTRLIEHAPEILAALVAQGAPADARLTLSAPDAILLTDNGVAPHFESVSYNAATGRFLIRARGADSAPLVAITGRAAALSLLPTPTRDIARGETITEEDIAWTEFDGLARGAFIDDADLAVGKNARRPLTKGAPIRKLDLSMPVLVKRGATVTVILEAPGLRLTQAGVALAQGSEGDAILIRNINSGQEVRAVVIGRDLAQAPFRGAPTLATLTTER